jgi:NTP pyrophosphatase (non-canonical NTP hydrolase)
MIPNLLTVSSQEGQQRRRHMDITEYAKEVHRTCNITDQKELLTLAALGIAGEAGEVVDTVKKVLYHSHELDISSLSKEVGDLLWYMVLLCDTVGFTLDDVMQANVEKLRKRYPHGFDTQKSRERQE